MSPVPVQLSDPADVHVLRGHAGVDPEAIGTKVVGFTRGQEPFPDRLLTLCEGVIELTSESDQHLTLLCQVNVAVPDVLADTLLSVAREFVGNAVRHGLYMRLIGRVTVTVACDADGDLVLTVGDDGWGLGPDCGQVARFGGGLRVADALAGSRGGRIDVARRGERTVARLVVPALQDA